MNSISLTPIGTIKSSQKKKYQASRQPDQLSHEGVITLTEGKNFDQAVKDLSDCSHIWIIYWFHENKTWKPMVTPPRSKSKKGVFATRSPYRPNPIGISAVKLLKVEGRKIWIGANDLLDGTPILDIKPYHPEVDQIADAQIKWLENETVDTKFKVKFSPVAIEQIEFIEKINHSQGQALVDTHLVHLQNFIIRQLEFSPTDKNKKRVKKNKEDIFTLSYRTWRIDFIIQDKTCAVLSLRSGYKNSELTDIEMKNDKYGDKVLHKKFKIEFES